MQNVIILYYLSEFAIYKNKLNITFKMAELL